MTRLLDTTLRDGSYVTNFQFDLRDTAIIASALDAAGVPLIETGHGLGLRAGSKAGMRSPFPDEAYLEVCQSSVRRSQWGMFFIPGIGELADIERATRFGMHFVRIGTDVTSVATAEPAVRRAKELGLLVATNFMKTYALSAEAVGREAARAASFGVDSVCIVDSAGGMLPEDVERYVAAIRNETDVAIGFHGHNNLGLGMANALRAVELGCSTIDASVRGLGRSAGNTVTEMFVLAMRRRGIELGVDVLKLFDLAETIIDPLLRNYRQLDSLGIISGYAQFHSAFLEPVLAAARAHAVDARELIVHVSAIDKIQPTPALIEAAAATLAEAPPRATAVGAVPLPRDPRLVTASNLAGRTKQLAGEVASAARRQNLPSAINIVQTFRPDAVSVVSPLLHEGAQYVVGSVEVANAAAAHDVATAIDGQVDCILLDIDAKGQESRAIADAVRKVVAQTTLVLYSDLATWSEAVVALCVELGMCFGVTPAVRVIGQNALAEAVTQAAQRLGFVIARDMDSISPTPIAVFCESCEGRLALCGGADIIIDAIVGAFTIEELEAVRALGTQVRRVDMHSQIQAVLSTRTQLARRLARDTGLGTIADEPVVSGGIVAAHGTVVVDSTHHPTRVLGVADGQGFLIAEDQQGEEIRQRLGRVRQAIDSRILQ